MKLSELEIPTGARKLRTRVGRGEGSGHGKTSGRGGKGQTARSGGGVRPGFEGGQMPLYRRLGKIGFRSQQRVYGVNRYQVVNLSVLNKLEEGSTVDAASMRALGYGRSAHAEAGLKILATGDLQKKLHIKASAISAAARAKVEAVGGTVEIVAAS